MSGRSDPIGTNDAGENVRSSVRSLSRSCHTCVTVSTGPKRPRADPDRAVAPASAAGTTIASSNKWPERSQGSPQTSPGKDGGGSVDRAAQTWRDRQADVREGAVADRVWQEAHRGLRRGGRPDGSLARDRGNRLLPHGALDAGRRRCQAAPAAW